MARKLAANVVLLGDDGEPVTYAAHTSPPADVAKQITNPAAWLPDDGSDDVAPEPAKKAARKAPAKKATAGAVSGDKTPGGAEPTAPADDAGDDAWRAFAATVGVTVAGDADTAAVKAQLTDRGLLEP